MTSLKIFLKRIYVAVGHYRTIFDKKNMYGYVDGNECLILSTNLSQTYICTWFAGGQNRRRKDRTREGILCYPFHIFKNIWDGVQVHQKLSSSFLKCACVNLGWDCVTRYYKEVRLLITSNEYYNNLKNTGSFKMWLIKSDHSCQKVQQLVHNHIWEVFFN